MNSRASVLAAQLLVCSTCVCAISLKLELGTSSNQGTTIGPLSAPIFRETECLDDDALEATRRPFSIDDRDCVPDNLDARAIEEMFDAGAKIELDMENRQFVEQGPEIIAGKSAMGELHADERERYAQLLALNRAQAKMAAAIEKYRTKLQPSNQVVVKPAFRLGDLGRPHEPLGANINNYAPDNFVDQDVTRLFDMHREVREQLARDAATGECRLYVGELRALNKELREIFKKAMLDYAPAVEDSTSSSKLEADDVLDLDQEEKHEKEDEEEEECAICRESLASEPTARLSCGHVYHKSCLASWARMQNTLVNTCPKCRKIFRLPYRMVEKLSNLDLSGRRPIEAGE